MAFPRDFDAPRHGALQQMACPADEIHEGTTPFGVVFFEEDSMAPKGAPKKETKEEAEPKVSAKKKHAEAAADAGPADAHAKGHEKKPKEHEEKPHAAAHAPFHSKSLSREDAHCKIKGCKRSYKAKGYCQPHYREWRNGKFGKARFDSCGEFNCFRPMATNRHGMCEEHYVERYVKGIAAAKPEAPKKEEKEEAKESA